MHSLTEQATQEDASRLLTVALLLAYVLAQDLSCLTTKEHTDYVIIQF